MLSYFSDARFRAMLAGDDPLAREALRGHRDALMALLRETLEPRV